MAWDFSTEPEFQAHLDWMREFVREEIWPMETLDLDQEQIDRAIAPLQEQVKERGLWAAHLDPELGGQGYGQVKLGLMHEILGTSPYAPLAFGNQAPDSGNSEILALAGTPKQKERWLHPLLAGDLKSAFSMTEPETPGSDPTQLATRAVRDGDGYVINGHKWYSSNGSIADFLIVMAVTDPDALPAGPWRAAARQADRAELDRGLVDSDSGGTADDVARGVEDRHAGLERRARRRLPHQGLRRTDALRRRRPCSAAARRARLLDR